MLPQADNHWTIEEAAHLLNRAGFGGNPHDVATLHAMGRMNAVDSFLQPTENIASIKTPAWTSSESMAQDARKRFEAIRAIRMDTNDMSDEERENKRRMALQQLGQEERSRGLEAQGWWLDRMLLSRAPLREKMTLFWHDHFANSLQKVKQPALLFQQNQLFRSHALGNFKDLTHAVARDGAMMLFLDMQTSVKGKPNENFAREVMELFTLGQGHYTEEDIRQAARAFTGYTINRFNGKVTHNKRQWDEGEKIILGQKGNFDGDGVIEVIFQQDQVSRYMAGKLWEFFAFENPGPAVVDSLANTMRQAKFEVAPVLRELFLSKEFYSETCMANQIKCPVFFLVQMLKQLEIPSLPKAYALSVQNQLGQILFVPPNVAGWDWGKAWINTNTLLTRYQISGVISHGGSSALPTGVEGAGFKGMAAAGMSRLAMMNWDGPDYDKLVPRDSRNDLEKMVDSLINRLFQRKLSGNVRERFIAYARDKQGVVFTNQEVGELVHLMMSTPHYQLC